MPKATTMQKIDYNRWTPLNLRITEEMRADLINQAKYEETDISSIVRKAIAEYLYESK